MALPIVGLHSHNFSSTGSEELIAVMGTKTFAYRSGSWLTGATVTTGKNSYMTSFNDKVLHVNDTDNNFEYNGLYWTALENMKHTPIGKFVGSQGNTAFLYGLKINNGGSAVLNFPSRVWFSNFPKQGKFTWGIQYGSDLTTTAGSAVVTSASALFLDRDIKIGDELFITQSSVGNFRAQPYIVQSIDSQTQITLTENILKTSTTDKYIVGGNYFDVDDGDGDVANGIGMASNEMLFFKKNSVYRYNKTSEELRQIKDAPGTTSPRSIVSWGGYCYWYHPSGIYRTSGANGEKISNAIDDIIEGVTTSNQSLVVGWKNQTKNTVNMYVGDVTLRDGESIEDCVLTLDLNSNIWAPRAYNRPFKVAANWIRSNNPEVYVGDDSQGVFQLDTGTQFKTTDIPFALELYPTFPAGEDAIVTFHRVRTYIENGPDVQIFYKLIYKPGSGPEGFWNSDDTWFSLKGTQIADRVDWDFPPGCRASGVKLKIVESSGDESFLLEKITIYYSDEANF